MTKASVPRVFLSDSFESSIVMAPQLESKLTTVPSCKVKENTNKHGGIYCNSKLETREWSAGNRVVFQITLTNHNKQSQRSEPIKQGENMQSASSAGKSAHVKSRLVLVWLLID